MATGEVRLLIDLKLVLIDLFGRLVSGQQIVTQQ